MKSELDGAIFVIYRFKENLNDYFQIFKGCMDAITRVNLRLEKTHSYHPNIFVENNFFMIFEQGRYKEPHIMEEEIDQLLLDIINGKIICENYNDIVTSFKTKKDEKIEKNIDNLFNEFITGTFTNDENVNSYLESDFPENFTDFMEQISVQREWTSLDWIVIEVLGANCCQYALTDGAEQRIQQHLT